MHDSLAVRHFSVLPKRSKENDSAQNLSTTNCIIIGADDVDTPNMDGNPASSHKSITITTDIKPEHHYDISVEDGEDTEPPTSSIDDLIRSCSSVSSSSESTQGGFISCCFVSITHMFDPS